MESIRYGVQTLRSLCREIFEKHGFCESDADTITDVLILADLFGIRSHGLQRLMRYHAALQQGSAAADAVPEIVFETPVSAVIDGHAGMGQLTSVYAANLAIRKAKSVGMAFVTVRNSNHFGIAGYYSKMAADAGLLGIAVTNTESIMVHTGAKQAILGSNPIAFAMPAEPYPFWFDAATTVIPKGKLEICYKNDQPLHDGWAADETGASSRDAAAVFRCITEHRGTGGIFPVGGSEESTGGHKGYGFAMICELLCAITSGGATSNHHIHAPGEGAGTCHAFLTVDPAVFGDPEEIKANLSRFLQELRDAEPADARIPIYTHGEKEFLQMEISLRDGIALDISTIGEIQAICAQLGIDTEHYLGRVDTAGAKKSLYGQKPAGQ